MNKIIENISKAWNAGEGVTSILYDHQSEVVHLETNEPTTAREWAAMFKDDPKVTFDRRSDSLKLILPAGYCIKANLIIKASHGKADRNAESAA